MSTWINTLQILITYIYTKKKNQKTKQTNKQTKNPLDEIMKGEINFIGKIQSSLLSTEKSC